MEYAHWKIFYESKNESEIKRITDLLDSKGIMATTKPADYQFRFGKIFGKNTYQILVHELHFEKAREILAQA